MGNNSNYSDQLNDPRWKAKRKIILLRDKKTCVKCGRNDIPLHIHHIYPLPFRAAWDYTNEELETLCENCHAWETMYQRSMYRLTGDKIWWNPISEQAAGIWFDFLRLSKEEALNTFEQIVQGSPLQNSEKQKNDENLLQKLKKT